MIINCFKTKVTKTFKEKTGQESQWLIFQKLNQQYFKTNSSEKHAITSPHHLEWHCFSQTNNRYITPKGFRSAEYFVSIGRLITYRRTVFFSGKLLPMWEFDVKDFADLYGWGYCGVTTIPCDIFVNSLVF